MKVTKEQLKQLISEEIKNAISEVHSKPLYVPPQADQEKTPAPAAADKGGSLQDEIDDLKRAVKDVLAKLEELENY